MKLQKLPKIKVLFRKNFFAGVLVLIPLAVIAWLGQALMGNLWALHRWFFGSLHIYADSFLLKLVSFAGAMIVFGLAVSILGWISKLYLGRKILEILGDIIQKIPVLGTIYSSLDQLLRTLALGGNQQFSRVVLFEYPRKGIWAIAFVTGPVKNQALPPGYVNVFIPTVPNPTSGFHLLVQESEIRDSGLSVEAAFKIILSLGIAQPTKPK